MNNLMILNLTQSAEKLLDFIGHVHWIWKMQAITRMIFVWYNLRMTFSNRAPRRGIYIASIKLGVPEEIGDKVPSTSRKWEDANPSKACKRL